MQLTELLARSANKQHASTRVSTDSLVVCLVRCFHQACTLISIFDWLHEQGALKGILNKKIRPWTSIQTAVAAAAACLVLFFVWNLMPEDTNILSMAARRSIAQASAWSGEDSTVLTVPFVISYLIRQLFPPSLLLSPIKMTDKNHKT